MDRLGRYQILDPIGSGPCGSVVQAKVFGVVGVDRLFALKRILPALSADPACAQALSAAARAYGTLEHARIARLVDISVAQGQTFTATELVVGLDAGRLIAECRISGSPLPPGGALGLLIGAARAVGYAHGRGLLHLGLCPQNLLVTVDGDIKVSDFGILAACLPARPVDDPRLAHRVAYLAPEQLLGEPTSAATDVFALGALGIEMITGAPAFRGDTPQAVQDAVLAGQVNDPSLPGPIVRVLQRCLARSPFERFPDARALADALEGTLRTTPVRGTRLDVAERVNAVLSHLAALNEGGLSGVVSLPSAGPASPQVRPPTMLDPEVIATPTSLPDRDRAETNDLARDRDDEDLEELDVEDVEPVRRNDDTSDDDARGSAAPTFAARQHRVTDAPVIAATLRGLSSGATPRPMPPSSSGATATPPPPGLRSLAEPAAKPLAPPPVPRHAPPKSGHLPPLPREPAPSAEPPTVPSRLVEEPPVSRSSGAGATPPPLGPAQKSGPLPSIVGGTQPVRAASSFATVVPVRPSSPEEGREGREPALPGAGRGASAAEPRAPSAPPDIEVTTSRVGALVSAWDEAMQTFEQPTRVAEPLQTTLSESNRTGPAPRLDLAELLAPAGERAAADGRDPDPWAPVASVSTVFPESVPKRPSGLDLEGAPPDDAAPRPRSISDGPLRSGPLAIPKIPPTRPSQPPPLMGAALVGSARSSGSSPQLSSPGVGSSPGFPYPAAPPPAGNLIGDPFGAPPAAPEPTSRARWLWLLLGLIIVAGSFAGAYAVFFGGLLHRPGSMAVTVDASGSVVAVRRVDGAPAAGDAAAPDARAVAAAPDAGAVAAAPDAGAVAAAPDAGPEPVAPVPGDGDALIIESTPPGARVYIDGAEQGVTPVRVPSGADKHTAVLFLAGHELSTLELAKPGKYVVTLKEVTPPGGPAGIKVRCKLKDRYYISIDGKPTGSLCPSERLEVDRGEHVVETYDLVTEARRQFRVTVKDTSRSTRVRVD